jgi:hypothetical protein
LPRWTSHHVAVNAIARDVTQRRSIDGTIRVADIHDIGNGRVDARCIEHGAIDERTSIVRIEIGAVPLFAIPRARVAAPVEIGAVFVQVPRRRSVETRLRRETTSRRERTQHNQHGNSHKQPHPTSDDLEA